MRELRPVDGRDETGETQGPKVFVRAISTPPGLPWDQNRAAVLEARMGAPLALAEVAYLLRRLEPWRSGVGGRFAALYVRSDEIGDQLVTDVDVAGRRLRVEFLSGHALARRRRAAGAMIAVLAVAAFAVFGATLMALNARANANARLEIVEQQAAAKLRRAKTASTLKSQAVMLDRAHMRGRSLRQVLEDLAQTTAAKTAGARIQAFHWDRRYVAVEVRSDGSPFTGLDARVTRSARPLRPGVWLWILRPAAPASGAAASPSERR